ncbi:MAG: hypothetical protein ACOX5R_16600 [bacterium]
MTVTNNGDPGFSSGPRKYRPREGNSCSRTVQDSEASFTQSARQPSCLISFEPLGLQEMFTHPVE